MCYAGSMRRIRDFLALVKIGIVASNSLTALAGFALAAVGAGLRDLRGRGFLVLAGTSLLVGGSCAINNWIDRDLDALMERTRDRPTARGAMGAARTLGIGSGLGTAGLALLFAAAPLSAAFGLAGAFVYLVPYSLWAKRRGAASSLYIGGIAGAIPPLIGWSAVKPHLEAPAWVLFAFLAVWQQAHVRALALRRADEYRAAWHTDGGLGSSPERTRRSSRAKGWRPGLGGGGPALSPAGYGLAALPLSGDGPRRVCGILGRRPRWIAVGFVGFRSSSWPARMFAASLAYLVVAFSALVAAGI